MRTLFPLLLTLFLLSGFSSVYATHFGGGEITYECISPGTYNLRLTLYRVCDPTAAGMTPTANLCIQDSCGFSTSLNISQTSNSPQIFSQVCDSNVYLSSCNGGAFPAMERYIYEGTIVLPAPSGNCTGYEIGYQTCCRASSNNLVGQPPFYLGTRLEFPQSGCNSSPYLTNDPPTNFCVGTTNHFNYFAQDDDGDSLVYELVPAEEGTGFCPITSHQPVVYNSGYSSQSPMSGNSPFTLDPVSGQITFNPTQVGIFAVAMKVHQYDNQGTYHGYIMHDLFYTVSNCNTATNRMDTSFVTGSATLLDSVNIEACIGEPFCFVTAFSDSDSLDTLTITSNILQTLPGATWNFFGTNPASVQVCWIPQPTNQSIVSFGLTVEDNNCPLKAITHRTINIHLGNSMSAGLDQDVCLGDTVQLIPIASGSVTWTSIGGDPILVGVNIDCDTCLNPLVSPTQTTTYVLTQHTQNGNCGNTDTVTVNVQVAPAVTIAPLDTILCPTDTIMAQMNASPSSAGYSYSWLGSNGVVIQDPTNSTTSVGIAGGPGPFTIIGMAIDPLGCVGTDTADLQRGFNFNLANDSACICSGDTISSINLDPAYNYQWSPQIGISNTTIGNPLLYPTSTVIYTVNVTDPASGCSDQFMYTVKVADSTCVTGTVTTSSGNPLDNSWVYLFEYDTSTFSLTIYDSVMTDTGGHYKMVTTQDSFYLYALPDNALHPGEMLTYYDSELTFQNATRLYANCSTLPASFNTVQGTLITSITGSLGGQVVQGNNKTSGEGDPVPGLRVILMDDQLSPLRDAVTDPLGQFNFDVDQLGDYFVYVDRYAVDNGLAPQVTLTTTEPNKDNLLFKLLRTQLVLIGPLGTEENSLSGDLQLAPNPSDGSFWLQWTGDEPSGALAVKVFNALGQPVLEKDFDQGLITHTFQLDQPAPGLYLVTIESQQQRSVYRLLIK